MKKFIKKNIKFVLTVLVSVVLSSSVTGVVAYSFASNQVGYTPTDSNWQVTTVAEAIDDLYIKKTGDNYSTEERVVGTWIDGKPIYQKTFSDTITSEKVISTGASIDNVISYTAMMNRDNGFYQVHSTYATGDFKTALIISINNSSASTNPNSIIINANNSVVYNKTINITVQYTKTTDTVPNNNNQG